MGSIRPSPRLSRRAVSIAWLTGWAITWMLLVGCRAAAPLHVWTPPTLAPAAGSKVAIAPIRGDEKIAGPLRQAMLRRQPRDNGRSIVAIDASDLIADDRIRLVQALEGDDSDFAVVSLARRAGADFVLMGEVIGPSQRRRLAAWEDAEPSTSDFPQAMGQRPPHHQGVNPARDMTGENSATDAPADPSQQTIRVSWSLLDVRHDRPLSGQPVVTAGNPRAPSEQDLDAAATAAWDLLTPHVIRTRAELAAPRLVRGSRQVRQGNAAAAAGDWRQAEQIWQAVVEKQPRNHAALHNLALAAVARQQYHDARQRIAAALAIRSNDLNRTTAVWIEQSQRDYHQAFGLPDPPEGWAATRR